MPKKIIHYLPAIVFVLILLCLSIKASYLSLSPQEQLVIGNTHSFKEAISASRDSVGAPFVYSITAAIQIITDNIFVLRLPAILTGAFIVLAFYCFVGNLRFKYPGLLALVPITLLLVINDSIRINSFVYLSLFSLLSFYYGYWIVVDHRREVNFFSIALLAAAFALLPMISFYSFYHLALLTLSLAVLIIFYSHHKLIFLFYLMIFDLFALIIMVPFGDIIVALGRNVFGFPVKILHFNLWFAAMALIILILWGWLLRCKAFSSFAVFCLSYLGLLIVGLALIPALRAHLVELVPSALGPLFFLVLCLINYYALKNKEI